MKVEGVKLTRWAVRQPERTNGLGEHYLPHIALFDGTCRTTKDFMIYHSDKLFSDLRMLVEATHPQMILPLFNTKAQCQAYIKEHYGYIAKRKDLRREPHNMRMPKPVRVTVTVTEQRRG